MPDGPAVTAEARPGWVQHAIWWQVPTLGFVGAEPTALPAGAPVRHRLGHLVAWLDHLVALGASGLLLGPVCASSSHGYDTTDLLAVDPRLGDDADFDTLVREAHDRGVRVLLDGVFNHVGSEHPMFRQALAGGPGSAAAQWFHLFWPEDGAPVGPDGPEYAHFEGHRTLVTLNHASQAVRDHVVEVMCHWLDRGADGWRLDAAYAVPNDFWAAVLPRVRERHPDAYVVGEVIHGDYPSFVTEGGLDSVTEYELWKAVWSSLNDGNFHELAWTLGRHDALLDTFVPLTFVGNHDVTRIASRLDDVRHLPHALAALMTLAGTPSVYAGDEYAMRGVKEDRVGGDDAVRPSFPPAPADDDLPAEALAAYRLHQGLIGVRRRHPWLSTARTEVLDVTGTSLVWRSHGQDGALLTALSADDAELTVAVPGATGVLAGDGRLEASGADARVTLAPHGWAVLGSA
ncbi:alpha-amylase family protein [Kineosporia sp. R_H_3]|uniref:alpha-amylase family protein n=1 Tax=Kineosporia sp. R_H_3 TaxID=1961848 RepID=UPI000B4A8F15|nr:alpha-amylase family protein [Kineosporia sp. R_H_3]